MEADFQVSIEFLNDFVLKMRSLVTHVHSRHAKPWIPLREGISNHKMISCRGRNQLYESREVILQDQNVFKRLSASLDPLLNIKEVVMKSWVSCSSIYCFSQRSRDNWLVIDSAMNTTATETFDILFELFPEEVLWDSPFCSLKT